MSKGENEYIRKFDNNHEVYINENISICSDISDLTEMSEISYKVSGSNSYIKDNNWNNIS